MQEFEMQNQDQIPEQEAPVAQEPVVEEPVYEAPAEPVCEAPVYEAPEAAEEPEAPAAGDKKKLFMLGGIVVAAILIIALIIGLASCGGPKTINNLEDIELFNEGMIAVADASGKWGYVNKKGTWKIAPQYDYAQAFAENGLAAVRMADTMDADGRITAEGKWGYIDKKGNLKIAAQFDEAGMFDENGYAVVGIFNNGDEYSDYKYGVINKRGKYIMTMTYDDIQPMSNGLFIFERDGKTGAANKRGKEVITAMYDGIYGFTKDGYAIARMGGNYGIINTKGKIVINPQFSDYASPWYDVTKLEMY